MKNKIVAVVGLCGSGKTEATTIFTNNGYKKVYFGEVTFDELKRKNLPVTPENERLVREELRKNGDMAIYAKLSLPKIEKFFSSGENVVVESMYSWSEYKLLKETFGSDFLVLAIVVDKNLRVERLKNRKIRPLSKSEVETRDITEIENIEKAGPIAIADYFILNNGNLAELQQKIENFIENLR